MTDIARRVLIEGRVQGVGFRWWTRHAAEGLGLRGWVRNRRDCSVEAVFAGPAEAVSAMLGKCRTGPPSSRVIDLKVVDAEFPAETGFEAKPTV